MKKFKKLNIVLFLLLIVSMLLNGCSETAISQNDNNKFYVNYIDVGQGDSILITVNGKNMLIDAGPRNSTKKVISYLNKLNVKTLDYVIATHPHEDHIGGMSTVINDYNIKNFYAPKKIMTTATFSDMVKALKRKNLKINVPKPGTYIDLGKDTTCEVLSPSNNHYEDINNYSIVIKITYKNNKFLFMGDAQKSVEKEILNNGFDVSCDVLKAGHHGSNTSSSKEFLDKANPKIAVISCGKGNMYGHPHKQTLTEFKKRKIRTYRTDLDGDIVLYSDGSTISSKE